MELTEQFLKETLEEIIQEKRDVFGDFFGPLLASEAAKLRDWSARPEARTMAMSADLPRVAASLLGSVMGSWSETGVRTLITALRSQPDGETAMGYSEFAAWSATTQGQSALFARFPELRRLLLLSADRRLRHGWALLRSAARDRDVLRAELGADGRVTSVIPGLGDPHKGGETVSFVHFENGTTLVHKPQQESCHGLLERLRVLVDADGSYFGPLLPRTVDRGSHLWQERVTGGDVGTAGAGLYFRRFGRSAALLSMLGATDLHFENVIATAEGPVIIDTEALVTLPGVPLPGGAGALAYELEHSVINTMLFPARFKGATLDVDLSGIGCVRPSDSRHLRSFRVVDPGTDDIRFDDVAVTVEHGINMAVADGEVLDPRRWAGEVAGGFVEARDRLRPVRAEVEATVRDHGGWSVRQVVRPTYVYARFLEASTHPAYLGATSDRRALLAKLPARHRGLTGAASEIAHREEVEALSDLDFPFFDVTCDSRDLRGNGRAGQPSGAEVRLTPRESALRHVREFFDRPAGRDPEYIVQALSCSVDDAWGERSLTPPHDGTQLLADPAAWHSSIRQLVVEADDEPTWLTTRLDGDGLRLGSVDAALHEGGGLLICLAEAGRGSQDPSVLGVDPGAVHAAATPAELAAARTPSALSPFTGALSTLVSGIELRRRGMPRARVPRSRPAAAVDVAALTRADFDFLNGYGGYLLYTAHYPQHGGPRPLATDDDVLLARLIQLDGPPGEHEGDLGLAHGRFGRIAALSAHAGGPADPHGVVHAHLEAFAAAYLRHRWTDDTLRDPGARSAWCKGYTGIVHGLERCLTALGHAEDDIRVALRPEIEQILTSPVSPDLSFCHGLAGRVTELCRLSDRLDWPELRVEARTLSENFIARHGQDRTYGIGSLSDHSSFLLGLGGWHFSRLMLADPRVTPPLCLGGR